MDFSFLAFFLVVFWYYANPAVCDGGVKGFLGFLRDLSFFLNFCSALVAVVLPSYICCLFFNRLCRCVGKTKINRVDESTLNLLENGSSRDPDAKSLIMMQEIARDV